MKNKNVILNDYYIFDVDKNNCPIFTQKNILLLDALIKYNSSYSVASDDKNPEYNDSYAGILRKLKEEFFDFKKYEDLERKIDENLHEEIKKSEEVDENGKEKDDLYKVVESIDRINSTHLVSEGPSHKGVHKGRYKTSQKIRGIENLKGRLLRGDTDLIHIIASLSDEKHNFSYATKFCSYVCIHALGKDNYCIYDEVVQSILPYYINKYIDDKEVLRRYCKIVNKNDEEKKRVESTVCKLKDKKYKGNNGISGYKEYKNLIDTIILGIEKKDGIKIDYATFDHMLWYSFKGSKIKVQNIMNTLIDEIG